MKDQRTQYTFEFGPLKAYKFTDKEGDKGIFYMEETENNCTGARKNYNVLSSEDVKNPIWLKKRANKDVVSEIGQERSIQSDAEDCRLRYVTPTCSTRVKSLATVLMTFKHPERNSGQMLGMRYCVLGKLAKQSFRQIFSGENLMNTNSCTFL